MPDEDGVAESNPYVKQSYVALVFVSTKSYFLPTYNKQTNNKGASPSLPIQLQCIATFRIHVHVNLPQAQSLRVQYSLIRLFVRPRFDVCDARRHIIVVVWHNTCLSAAQDARDVREDEERLPGAKEGRGDEGRGGGGGRTRQRRRRTRDRAETEELVLTGRAEGGRAGTVIVHE